MTRPIKRCKDELGADNIEIIEPKANGFGTEPPSAGGLRSMGCLALSHTDLMFVTWTPQKEFRIPRSAITSVDTSADDLAGVQKAMITVAYTGDDGSEITASWRLTDIVEWLTALGYDFGPDGPPAAGRRTDRRPGSGRPQVMEPRRPRPWTDRRCPSPSGAGRSWFKVLGGCGWPLVTAMRRSDAHPGPGRHRAVGRPLQPRIGVEHRAVGVDGHAQGGSGGEGRGPQRARWRGGQQGGGEGAIQTELVDDAVDGAGHHQALAVGGEGHRGRRAQPVGARRG